MAENLRRRYRRKLLEPWRQWVMAPVRRWRNRGREFRPLLITGAMGSGTTLLAYAIAEQFACAGVIGESAHEIDSDSYLHVPALESFADVYEYLEYIQPRPDWQEADADIAIRRLYCGAADLPGQLIVDKGPNVHMARAEFLGRVLPDAEFLVVIRDPVVTIEGFRRKWSLLAGSPLADSIYLWRALHQAILDAVPILAGRILFFDYQRLVADLEGSLASLGSRVEAQAAPRRRRLPTRANIEGQGIRNVSRRGIGVVNDADMRARARIGAEEQRKIEEQLGPLYRRLLTLCG